MNYLLLKINLLSMLDGQETNMYICTYYNLLKRQRNQEYKSKLVHS